MSASPFNYQNFVYYWFTRIVGTIGNQMMMVAVAWQMYALTGSAWDLGLVGLFEFLPALALTLVTGSVVDRYDRRIVLGCCLALQGVVAGVLLWAVIGTFESRDLLLALAIALGTARAFQMPAQQALVVSLVPVAVLPKAISLSSGGNQSAVILGPALGGLLFAFGPPAVYGVSVAMFVLSCVLLARIEFEHVAPPRDKVTMNTLLAGIHFIWKHQVVLGAISLDLFAVLLGGATALLPIYAKDILHIGPFGLGILRSAPAVGAVAMSVVLVRWPITRRAGQAMFLSVAIYGLMLLVFAGSTNVILSFVALLVSGSADMVSVVIRQTLVQLETPDAMRGRVSAVNSVFVGASNQLGEFESGATAAALGPIGSVILGGIGTLVVAALWFKLFPELAHRQRLDEVAKEPAAPSIDEAQART
jgi:MFS family permease